MDELSETKSNLAKALKQQVETKKTMQAMQNRINELELDNRDGKLES